MDDAKNARAPAKRIFTRTANRLQQMIESNGDRAVVDNIFQELEKAHHNATEKHKAYICHVSEADPGKVDEEDQWITDVDKRFDELCILRQKHCVTSNGDKDIAAVDNETEGSNQENLRLFEEANFLKEVENALKMLKMKEEIAISVVKEKVSELKVSFERCKQMTLAKKGDVNEGIKKIEELQGIEYGKNIETERGCRRKKNKNMQR